MSVIRRLPEDVVHRIAAGEVVVSPAAAVKELMENCIDAKATSIAISARQGGLKRIQIVDNGCGIKREDLPLVCERFATSKLQKFEDLKEVATFGFRGEALASISQVARVKITSMAKGMARNRVLVNVEEAMAADSVCAYKASYSNGQINSGESGDGIEPCAGVLGTTLVVEDLFYNMPTRRKASRSPQEEYRTITDVVMRYSIKYAGIAFTCRKLGESSSADVKTELGATTIDNIRLGFGKNLSQELIDINFEITDIGIGGSGYISNANYSTRRKTFILFINGRLVDHTPLRKAVESVHSQFHPKGSFGFCFLDIQMNPLDVDVNVHPTKREVRFLHADKITENLTKTMTERLQGNQVSRVYYTQSLVRASMQESADPAQVTASDTNKESDEKKRGFTATSQTIEPRKKVRTDTFHTGGLMERFVETTERRGTGKRLPIQSSDSVPEKALKTSSSLRRSATAPPLLTSVRNLQMESERQAHGATKDLFREHVFVGVADADFCLVQHGRKLVMIELRPLMRELMYQKVLLMFGDLPCAELETPVPIVRVLEHLLSMPSSGWTEEMGNVTDVVYKVSDLLQSKAELLLEYFAIHLDSTGDSEKELALVGLPVVLPGHDPSPAAIPELLLHLGTAVNWEEEQACFHDISEHIAECYAVLPPVTSDDDASVAGLEQLVKHTIFPSTRGGFHPPTKFIHEKVVQEVASLERLYRTFERC